MNRIVVLIVAAGLLSAACSSSGSRQPPPSAGAAGGAAPSATAAAQEALVPHPIRGCVPTCNTPGITRPGKIPEKPYKTQWFFGRQMVITPSEHWSIHEDSTGEFSLTLDAAPANDVLFWEDVYPIEHNKRVPGVPLTVQGLLGWLQRTPRLHVSAPHPGTIGRDLPATVVDVTIAKGAKNEDPDVPPARASCGSTTPNGTSTSESPNHKSSASTSPTSPTAEGRICSSPSSTPTTLAT